jgi:hypothetical protein
MDLSVDYGGAVDRQIIRHSVRGRDKLIQAYHDVLEGWSKERLVFPGQQCSFVSNCGHKKLLVSQSLFAITEDDISLLGPRIFDSQLCKQCLDSLAVAYEKAREELWDRLPSFFGLSPWEELKDFDAYNSSDT